MTDTEPFTMRQACSKCGYGHGRIESRNGQNCVFCVGCNAWMYNAPKVETGEKTRSVTPEREAIAPKQRKRILERDRSTCLDCGGHAPNVILHVSHMLSVDDAKAVGSKFGIRDEFVSKVLDDDLNLYVSCERCNLGQGKRSIDPLVAFRLMILVLTKLDAAA